MASIDVTVGTCDILILLSAVVAGCSFSTRPGMSVRSTRFRLNVLVDVFPLKERNLYVLSLLRQTVQGFWV